MTGLGQPCLIYKEMLKYLMSLSLPAEDFSPALWPLDQLRQMDQTLGTRILVSSLATLYNN